jgi:cardiolipin synthase
MAKNIAQKLVFLLFLVVSGFSSGCAPLPKTAEIIEQVPADHGPPRIASSRGLLSPSQSKAIMERLKRSVEPTDILNRHLAVMETASGNPLVKGNRVELLVDGPATYAAMFKAIENAKDHVNMETFIFEDDETGRKLADLLIRKQQEGVQVNLIYDSVGSINTQPAFFGAMRDKGIAVLEYNPVNPLKARGKWRVTLRDHRKVLVVDGSIAITGGVNISQVYSSRLSGREKGEDGGIPWRDTDVLIEGPVVADFQEAFFSTWKWQKGPEVAKRNYFPQLKTKGEGLVQVIKSSPGEKRRTTFIMYVSAVMFAEKSVHLTNSYFVPDRQLVDALTAASRSGVDVKIILPRESDSSLALNAGRYYYAELLESGVKLYELRDAVLHAKTAVIDNVWSTVGSTNMDFQSFSSNNELNAVILSSAFASEMEQMFSRDLERSDPITKEGWNERPLHFRLREWFAHLFARLL